MIDLLALAESVIRTPQVLRVRPRTNLFLLKYFAKFRIRRVGPWRILHSHLPPINTPAYKRFVRRHLIKNISGPSHAQIGLTNACPQRCPYCYNANRSGTAMDTETIIRTIDGLGKLGVAWLGLTGGEPLLNRDITKIIDRTDKDIAIKLFTTGHGISLSKAVEMKKAGLTYVSVSLDSHRQEEHDRARRTPGAFNEALRAIGVFLKAGLHTGVSAVLPNEMMGGERLEEFLSFCEALGIHEVWLSEMKPSSQPFWDKRFVVPDEAVNRLVAMQDRYNRRGRMTFNYLGHFEHGDQFGCNAGTKMVYVDAYGEVSPCVFSPMTFGNVREMPVSRIYNAMKVHFRPDRRCFVNTNYALFKKHFRGISPIPTADAQAIAAEAAVAGPPEFNKVHGAFPCC